MRTKETALSERMKSEAIDLGLCQKWTEEWKVGTPKDEMVRKFIRGIDFCIEHDWPSVQVIKRDFGDVIHNHGVYADENVEAYNAPMVILNGECVADLEYTWTAAGEVYVRHNSEANIHVKGVARCFVSVYDKGEVNVECDEGARCFVYLYGGCVKKELGDGSIVIRDKRKGSDNEKE